MKKVVTSFIVLFITSFCFCQDKVDVENPILSYYSVKKNELSKPSKLGIGEYTQVYTQFIIDDKKEIKIISVRGPDLFLEKRTTQIINELPQVNPRFISSQKKNSKHVMQINFKVVK